MPEQLTERKSIWVEIKLDGGGFASMAEFDLRWELQDQIIERDIGILQGGGSGGGWMDFSFEVANQAAVEPALNAVRKLLTEYGVAEERVHFDVVDIYEQICDDTPAFQSGDCLSFRYQDGDYGAMLVISRRDEETEMIETLVALLNYKQTQPPEIIVFEKRQWLIATHQSRKGEPYLVWLHCYGGVEIISIGRIALRDDDPKTCNFTLSWDILAEQLTFN